MGIKLDFPKIAISILIITLFLFSFHYLFLKVFTGVLYLKGIHATRDKQYPAAIDHHQKAISIHGTSSKIWKALGHAYHFQATSTPFKDVFTVVAQAKKTYLKAADLNPLDAQIFFRLAIEETRLKRLHVYLGQAGQVNPYTPLPFFQKAIQLSPNNVSYHYALANFFYTENKTASLMATITNLGRIYPKIYDKLKKEPFWNIESARAFKKGIKSAIDEKISLQDANLTMSYLFADEKNWTKAIQYYQVGMEYQKGENVSWNFDRLGRLYVNDGKYKKAIGLFHQALLLSQEKENYLSNLYWFYKKKDIVAEYISLLKDVKNNFNSFPKIELLLARSLMDIKKYNKAKQLLVELNKKKPLAESYHLLAKMAEKEKDWNSMELSFQKATVLEPENYLYHYAFSKALKRLKKYNRAETEVTLAIRHSAKPRAWLYNYRGWIRWEKENYIDAVLDWKKAIRLHPDKDKYYAQIARAYDKMGQWKKAAAFYQKAMDLDPQNDNYPKKYHELIKKMN